MFEYQAVVVQQSTSSLQSHNKQEQRRRHQYNTNIIGTWYTPVTSTRTTRSTRTYTYTYTRSTTTATRTTSTTTTTTPPPSPPPPTITAARTTWMDSHTRINLTRNAPLATVMTSTAGDESALALRKSRACRHGGKKYRKIKSNTHPFGLAND